MTERASGVTLTTMRYRVEWTEARSAVSAAPFATLRLVLRSEATSQSSKQRFAAKHEPLSSLSQGWVTMYLPVPKRKRRIA